MSPLATFETNVRGTWNVLEACRLHRQLVERIVVASSDKAYGEHDDLPYTEEMALRPTYPYEVSKGCADLISKSYYETYRLPVAIARCGNIYGGGDLNWSRIVPGTIRSLSQGQSPILRSDGKYIRDYIYVKDVVDAYLTVAESLERKEVQGESFNFSSESRISVIEIVDRISELMDCKDIEPVISDIATGEIRDQYLSSAKATRILGWKSTYSLDEGLNETINWYGDFFASMKRPQSASRDLLPTEVS